MLEPLALDAIHRSRYLFPVAFWYRAHLPPVLPLDRMRTWLVILLAVLGGSTGVSALAAQDDTIPVEAPALRPGDVIRVTVWRKPELSGEFAVQGDGTIAHPFYSEVRVGGIPFAEAQNRVRAFVSRFESNPRVLIEPLYRVIVMGEVRQPNLYSHRPETTIAQALALAGGVTERGRLDRVRLVREEQEQLLDLASPGSEDGRLPIRSGDEIVVARRRDVFRDYIAPVASVTAAGLAILGFVVNLIDNDGPTEQEPGDPND